MLPADAHISCLSSRSVLALARVPREATDAMDCDPPREGPVCREQATPDSDMVSADGATVVDYLKADLLPGSSVEADLAVFAADLVNCEPLQQFNQSSLPLHEITSLKLSSKTHRVHFDIRHTPYSIPSETSGFWHGTDLWTYAGPEIDKYYVLIWSRFKNSSAAFTDGLVGIICQTEYTMAARTVRLSPASISEERKGARWISDEIKKDLPLSTSHGNLTTVIHPKTARYQYLRYGRIYNPHASNSSVWYSFLNQTAPQTDMTAFENTTLLEETSRTVFRFLAPQALQGCAGSAGPDCGIGLPAIFAVQELRVCVREMPLRLLETEFAILVFLTIGVGLPSRPIDAPNTGQLLTHALLASQKMEGADCSRIKQRVKNTTEEN